MDYRPLGRTGQTVSAICLGTMTWGEQNTEADGHAQMDHALDSGINFFDTAELYAIPPKAETQGATETIIGTWFAARKTRDRVILATKLCGRGPMNWFRRDGGGTAVTPAQIEEAVEGSLKRLRTDYIDLYQIHWPDRPVALFGAGGPVYRHRTGEEVAVEVQLEALDRLVAAGKVRWIGLSNETPWGVMAFLRAAELRGLPRVQSVQNAYNLVNRSFEMGLAEIAMREGTGLLAYSPLGQGYLTGKYRDGRLPAGSRKQLFERLQRYETKQGLSATARYLDLAAERGLDPAQMAIAFTLSRPFVTASIIGATSLEQLRTDIAAVDVRLDEETLAAIDAIHADQPNPSL